jgi:hypothetical protein
MVRRIVKLVPDGVEIAVLDGGEGFPSGRLASFWRAAFASSGVAKWPRRT